MVLLPGVWPQQFTNLVRVSLVFPVDSSANSPFQEVEATGQSVKQAYRFNSEDGLEKKLYQFMKDAENNILELLPALTFT